VFRYSRKLLLYEINSYLQAAEKGLGIFQNVVGIVSPHFKVLCGLHFQEDEAAHKRFPFRLLDT
jgi:hypothetical protein